MAHSAVSREAGRGAQPQHGARDDAERAFRADEQLAQIIAGIVLGHAVQRRQHGAIGQHGLDAQHIVTGDAMADHADAAGIGGDIAADLAGAAGTQIDRQQEAGGFGDKLRHLERRSGQKGHGAGGNVDLLDAGHALQRYCDIASARIGAAGKAREATLRHDGLAVPVADGKGGCDLFGAGGTQNGKR